MSLGYQFSPVPQSLQDKVDFIFKGNKRCVLNRIVNEIYLFPETRETLTKELAYRFIAKKLNMDFANVGKVIKKLEKIGVIKIIKKGTRKVGSLIQLCLDTIETLYQNACNKISGKRDTKKSPANMGKNKSLVVRDTTKKKRFSSTRYTKAL